MVTRRNNMNRNWGITFGIFVILLSVFIVLQSKVYSGELKLKIHKPKNDSNVCWRTIVEGNVSDPKLHVYVAIHPMATNKFWIQPIPTVSSDGKWKTYCYFGEPMIGIGEPFEIIAIASDSIKLFKEGDTMIAPLSDNPQILIRSNPITVIRAKC
jgi:hypothetical protein